MKRIKTSKIKNMKLPICINIKCCVGRGIGVGTLTFYDDNGIPLFKYRGFGTKWHLHDLTLKEATSDETN